MGAFPQPQQGIAHRSHLLEMARCFFFLVNCFIKIIAGFCIFRNTPLRSWYFIPRRETFSRISYHIAKLFSDTLYHPFFLFPSTVQHFVSQAFSFIDTKYLCVYDMINIKMLIGFIQTDCKSVIPRSGATWESPGTASLIATFYQEIATP